MEIVAIVLALAFAFGAGFFLGERCGRMVGENTFLKEQAELDRAALDEWTCELQEQDREPEGPVEVRHDHVIRQDVFHHTLILDPTVCRELTAEEVDQREPKRAGKSIADCLKDFQDNPQCDGTN